MENAKRKPAVAAEIAGRALVLTFANGKELAVSPDELSAEVRDYATFHGLKSKLVDAAAISRDPDTGRSATVDDKYQAVKTVYDRLLAGMWNAPRGEGGGNAGGLLLRALRRLYPNKTAEALQEYLAGKTAAEKTALRANPKVAPIIEELRAEKVDTGAVDTDALLDELEGGE